MQEAGQSDDIDRLEYGLLYGAVMFLLFWFVPDNFVLFHFADSDSINSAVTFFVLSAIPTIPFTIVNWRAIFGKKIVYTRKVRQ